MNGPASLKYIAVSTLLFLGIVGCDEFVVADGTEKYFSKELVNAKSPKGNRVLKMGEGGDSVYSFTQVLVEFDGCVLNVYTVPEKNIGVKASWKGNDTVIIQTKKGLKVQWQQYFAQCFSQKVQIVYLNE